MFSLTKEKKEKEKGKRKKGRCFYNNMDLTRWVKKWINYNFNH